MLGDVDDLEYLFESHGNFKLISLNLKILLYDASILAVDLLIIDFLDIILFDELLILIDCEYLLLKEAWIHQV